MVQLAFHRTDGQNVLFGDGHVSISNGPFVGTQRDNIYDDRRSGAAKDVPTDNGDSILLPEASGITDQLATGIQKQADTPFSHDHAVKASLKAT